MRRAPLFLLLAGLCAGIAAAPGGRGPDPERNARSLVAPGALIVKLSAEMAERLERRGGAATLDLLAGRHHAGRIERVFPEPIFGDLGGARGLDRIYRLKLPASADMWRMAEEVSADPDVVWAEPDYLGRAMEVPDDPLIGDQYALSRIGAFDAWDIETGSPEVLIAIVDTGVDSTHPDLAGKVRLDLGYDFFAQDADPMDTYDHGTGVAGGAAAVTDNGEGVAGVCWGCEILPVRVGNTPVHIGSSSVARGIVHAAQQGADVINLSLGGQCSQLWIDAVTYAHDAGAVLVAAAGTSVPFVVYPARFERVISVSSTDPNDRPAADSARGPDVEIAAPGVGIRIIRQGGGYRHGSGTSHAAPLVSGTAALLLSLNPALTNVQIHRILLDTARDMGERGFDIFYGHGMLDAEGALKAAAGPPTVETVLPPEVCGCVLEQTSLAPESSLATLRRFRDEVLATSPIGRAITETYHRHSGQIAGLLIADPELAIEAAGLLSEGGGFVDSFMNGDGAAGMRPGTVESADRLVRELARRGNSGLSRDLLRVWRSLDPEGHRDRPASALVRDLSTMPLLEP